MADLTGIFNSLLSLGQSIGNVAAAEKGRPEDAPDQSGLYTDLVASALLAGAKPGVIPGTAAMKDASLSENPVTGKSVTPLLDLALICHASLSLLNGFGVTEKGSSVAGGQGHFGNATTTLRAQNGDSAAWQGRAADEYVKQNDAQIARIRDIAANDRELIKTLKKEGYQVETLRSDFGGVKTTLILAIPIAVAMYWLEVAFPITYPPGLSLQWQALVAGTCLHADIGLQTHQGVRALEIGKRLREIANTYTAIAQEATTALPLHTT